MYFDFVPRISCRSYSNSNFSELFQGLSELVMFIVQHTADVTYVGVSAFFLCLPRNLCFMNKRLHCWTNDGCHWPKKRKVYVMMRFSFITVVRIIMMTCSISSSTEWVRTHHSSNSAVLFFALCKCASFTTDDTYGGCIRNTSVSNFPGLKPSETFETTLA